MSHTTDRPNSPDAQTAAKLRRLMGLTANILRIVNACDGDDPETIAAKDWASRRAWRLVDRVAAIPLTIPGALDLKAYALEYSESVLQSQPFEAPNRTEARLLRQLVASSQQSERGAA